MHVLLLGFWLAGLHTGWEDELCTSSFGVVWMLCCCGWFDWVAKMFLQRPVNTDWWEGESQDQLAPLLGCAATSAALLSVPLSWSAVRPWVQLSRGACRQGVLGTAFQVLAGRPGREGGGSTLCASPVVLFKGVLWNGKMKSPGLQAEALWLQA
jgi:hypothetical protein